MNISVKGKYPLPMKEGEYFVSYLKVSQDLDAVGCISEIRTPLKRYMNIFVRDTGDDETQGWRLVRKRLLKMGVRRKVRDFALGSADDLWILESDGKLIHISDDFHTTEIVLENVPYFRLDFSPGTAQLVMADRDGLAVFEDKQKTPKIIPFDAAISEIVSKSGFNFAMGKGGAVYLSTNQTYTLIKANESGCLEKVISEPRLHEDTRFVKYTPSLISRIFSLDGGEFLLLSVISERGVPECGGHYFELLDPDLQRIEKWDVLMDRLFATNGARNVYYIESDLIKDDTASHEGGFRFVRSLREGELVLGI